MRIFVVSRASVAGLRFGVSLDPKDLSAGRSTDASSRRGLKNALIVAAALTASLTCAQKAAGFINANQDPMISATAAILRGD